MWTHKLANIENGYCLVILMNVALSKSLFFQSSPRKQHGAKIRIKALLNVFVIAISLVMRMISLHLGRNSFIQRLNSIQRSSSFRRAV